MEGLLETEISEHEIQTHFRIPQGRPFRTWKLSPDITLIDQGSVHPTLMPRF